MAKTNDNFTLSEANFKALNRAQRMLPKTHTVTRTHWVGGNHTFSGLTCTYVPRKPSATC